MGFVSNPLTLGPKEAPMSVLTLPLRSVVESGAGPLILNQRSFPAGTDVAAIIDGSAVPESVTLTSDGRGAVTTVWHRGPEAEWVFVERWTAAGRAFHGWVDSVSRRLLQSG